MPFFVKLVSEFLESNLSYVAGPPARILSHTTFYSLDSVELGLRSGIPHLEPAERLVLQWIPGDKDGVWGVDESFQTSECSLLGFQRMTIDGVGDKMQMVSF
jgi:hypothetical protein